MSTLFLQKKSLVALLFARLHDAVACVFISPLHAARATEGATVISVALKVHSL